MQNTQTKRRRPSASMIVAAVALVLALTGSAIAGTGAADRKLSKSKVAKIAAKQANGVVTSRAAGLDVNSARTATTARTAATAENAANAENAAAVGGVRLTEIDYSGANDSAAQTIFEGGGLTIRAECQSSAEIAITATTTKSGSSIYASHVATDFDKEFPSTNDLENEFDPGVGFNLLTLSDSGLTDSGLTTFEYDAADGSTVGGTISTNETTTNPQVCEANGHVMAS